MARWVWEREARRLVMDGDTAHLHGPDGVQSGPLDTLGPAIRAGMGLDRLAEARAVAAHPEWFAAPLPETASLRARPTVTRRFGASVRGRIVPSASIGRGRVRVSGPDREPYEATVEDVAREGLPEPVRATLGASDSDALVDACRALAALPCECGTGMETRGAWRHLRYVIGERDPRAPIEVNSTVYRCAVCTRLWTVGESGDSHYSWHYTVSAFGGQPG